MRNSRCTRWPNEQELSRKPIQEPQRGDSKVTYYNHPISRLGGLNSYTHGCFGDISSNSSEFMDLDSLHNFNHKSPYNNKPISRFTRLIAALTVLSVVLSGPSALLGRETVSEEEKGATPPNIDFPINRLSHKDYAKIRDIVVNTIVQEGLITNKQSTTFIEPAITAKVKGAQ